jgi:ribosomal protein L9
MLYQPKPGELFQIILTVLVLGMSSACESEIDKPAMLKDAQIKVLQSEQLVVAAEARMKDLNGKVQETEKAKTAAIEVRQALEQDLNMAQGDVTFHTDRTVIFFGLIIAAFITGLRQGEERMKDNEVIRKSIFDEPYIEMFAQAANAGNHKLSSARS